jgi:hypothetical protein
MIIHTNPIGYTPIKSCGCCERQYTRPQWRSLKYIGVQDVGDGEYLELRNCSCGSTLGMPTPMRTRLVDRDPIRLSYFDRQRQYESAVSRRRRAAAFVVGSVMAMGLVVAVVGGVL